MNLMSISPLVFFIHHLLLTTTAADLITTACNRTLYYDVCVTSLLSDSRSRGADLRGLAAISIDLTAVHANNTLCTLKTMKAAGGGGSRAKMALNDCLDQYGDAIENLNESAVAFVQADYDTVNIMVSAAMTDADSCSSGFTERKKGTAAPAWLRMMNDYFCKLCSNSLAITALLA